MSTAQKLAQMARDPNNELGEPFEPAKRTILLGKTTTSHAGGATEDVDIVVGATKGSESNAVKTIPVFNRFDDIAEDVFVYVTQINKGPEILGIAGGSVQIAWGYISAADCENGSVTILVDLDTTNCGELLGADYTTIIEAYDTPLEVMRGYTPEMLESGLYAKAIFAWDRAGCTGLWRLDEIEVPPGCSVAIDGV